MFLGKATAAAALVGSLLVPAIASAQYGDTGDSERPTIHVFGQVGAAQIIRTLDVQDVAKLKGGLVFGGGFGMQFNPNFAVRASFDVSPTEGEGESTVIHGDGITRTFFGVDIQLRHVTERGIAPYLLLGLGGVNVSNGDEGFDSFARLTGNAGIGVEYLPKSGSLSYFGQGAGKVYNFKADIFDRTQMDVLWTVGVKYRITN